MKLPRISIGLILVLVSLQGVRCGQSLLSRFDRSNKDFHLETAIDEGYWFSRYNTDAFFSGSKAGETVAGTDAEFNPMIASVSDSLSTAGDPKSPLILLRSANESNPAYSDSLKLEWNNPDVPLTTPGETLGWSILNALEASKNFNRDAEFGIVGANDVPAAQERFSGLLLCRTALEQAQEFISHPEKFDLSRLKDKSLLLWAFSDLSLALQPKAVLGSTTNRCYQLAEVEFPDLSTQISTQADLLKSMLDAPTNMEEMSLGIQALVWYSHLRQDLPEIKELILQYAAQLMAGNPSSLIERSHTIRGLTEVFRLTSDSQYAVRIEQLFKDVLTDYDSANAVFKSVVSYTPESVAVVLGSLYTLLTFGNQILNPTDLSNCVQIFQNFFENSVAREGLQISAPPFEAIPEYARKTEISHRYPGMPIPEEVPSEFGVAPVFAGEIQWSKSAKAWKRSISQFDAAGGLHLSTELLWFYLSKPSLGDIGTGPGGDVTPTPPPGSGSGPTFTTIQETIFNVRCIKCHSGAGAPQGLQLDAANSYNKLVSATSSEVPTLKRVNPGDPTNSYLVIKIIPTDSRRIGDRMPRDGPPYLTDAEIQLVKDWITAGALKN